MAPPTALYESKLWRRRLASPPGSKAQSPLQTQEVTCSEPGLSRTCSTSADAFIRGQVRPGPASPSTAPPFKSSLVAQSFPQRPVQGSVTHNCQTTLTRFQTASQLGSLSRKYFRRKRRLTCGSNAAVMDTFSGIRFSVRFCLNASRNRDQTAVPSGTARRGTWHGVSLGAA